MSTRYSKMSARSQASSSRAERGRPPASLLSNAAYRLVLIVPVIAMVSRNGCVVG
jgi:hypothetical protein